MPPVDDEKQIKCRTSKGAPLVSPTTAYTAKQAQIKENNTAD